MGIGDAIMDTGAARIAQKTDPRRVRIMLGHKGARWDAMWENNPRLARPNEVGDFQIIWGRDEKTNQRAYHLAKTPERWIYNPDFRAPVGEFYFATHEVNFAKSFDTPPEIVVEPNIKPKASPNKRYPWDRWQEFAYMATAAGFKLYQLGPAGTRTLTGVRLIETPTFRQAASLLSRARAYVGNEGGLHHAAAAVGVPGVVIFGGFTPVELTGYSIHRNLGVGIDNACGMRIHCDHCDAEMAKITPEQILHNLRGNMK